MRQYTPIIGRFLFTVVIVNLCACATTRTWPPGLNSADRQQLRTLAPVAKPWPGGPADGRLIQTAHYRIYTTIDSAVQQQLLARVLEADYARFIRLVPQAAPKLPMIGYVFRNRRQWAQYTRKVTGNMAPIYLHIEAGGYERNGVFAAYRSTVPEILSVVAHEAWHQFSFLALKDHLPAWLDEGLATQCEAMQWHHGQPRFTPWLNTVRWAMLRQAVDHHTLLPLSVLAGTQAGSVVFHNPTYIQAYYAEVWSFMLFLEHSRYRPKLLDLLTMARDGQLDTLLAGSGLSSADEQHLTLRWNRIAGEIYLRHFFGNRPKLKRRYVAFIDHLVQSWPPSRPVSSSASVIPPQGVAP